MTVMTKVTALLAATTFGVLAVAPAAAQTTTVSRISRTGSDSGDCSVTACRTFPYTLNQTATNGRLICVDSGSFAPMGTITRSVTIDCTGTNAVIAAAAGTAVALRVDDTSTASPGTIDVTIRGLTFDGVGFGEFGIIFASGFALTLDNVAINNWSTPGAASNQSGIVFGGTRAARLHIANSSITRSGGVNGAGIQVNPSAGGNVGVVLENVQFVGNRVGLSVNTTSATGSSTNVVLNRSVISGSTSNGVQVDATGASASAGVTITNSTINGNVAAGIAASGARSQVRVENSTIAGNSTGIAPTSGAIIASYGNNSLIGNGVNGSFNGFPSEN